MRVNYPYLKDEKFLNLADKQRLQTQYIKLTLLDWNENPIQEIQGIATGGTISLSGSSAIRRTCTLNMTLDEIAETAITSVKNLISINKKLFLEIGIVNKTNKYPEYPILWYPQGTFVFTSCNLSSGIGQGYTLSAQLKDKMCLLNGECGGTFTSSVELDKYDTLDPETGEMYTTKNTISQIIRELVNHFGKIPLDKIIINDIDEQIKMTMRWSGDMPLYLAQKDSSYLYTTSYADAIAYGGNIKTFQYGEDCGFILTDFIYPSELIANIGDNICTILDKVKNTLGNYEYYFDIDGNFIFQEIKNYLNTTQATVNLQNMQNDDYKIDIAKGKSVYDFKDAELIINYSNNPNYSNIKNDYVVWGIKENANKIKIPIRYHLAIDSKPQTGNIYNVYMYYDTEDGLLKAKMPVGFENKAHFPTIGNEELFYLDKSTGFVYKWDVDKRMYVSPDGKEYGVYSDTEPGNNNTIYVDSTELQTGSGTNANLTNTAGNRKLSFKKYYGNTTQETTILPSAYQQVEYIESSGTQYIDTGYQITAASQSYSAILDAQYSSSISGNAILISSNVNAWMGQSNGYYAVGSTFKSNVEATTRAILNVSFGTSSVLNVNGETITRGGVENEIGNVKLFGKSPYSSSAKIYRAKIFNSSNVLVRDLIPCFRNSDNVIGMYDLVNNLFYTNAGTGTFTKGNNSTLPNPYFPQPINVVTGGNTISVVGKNLLKTITMSSNPTNISGLIITKNDDDTYTLNGKKTSGGTYYLRIGDNFTLEAGTYTLSNSNELVGVNNACFYDDNSNFERQNISTKTFTETKTIKPYIRIQPNVDFDNFVIKPMIERSNQATEYEPRKETNYELNLGKNLWDWTQNNITLIKSTNRTTNIYPTSSIILEAGTYTISFPNLEMANNNYNMNIQMLGVENYGEQLINKSRTFTINEKKTLTRLYVYLSSSDNDNATATFSEIQLEKGSQATSYSPYKTPIELNKINTYQDTIFKSSGKNLIDTIAYNKSCDASGVIANAGTPNNYLSINDYVEVKPNTTYTISFQKENGGYMYVSEKDINGSFIRRTMLSENVRTFTTGNTTYQIFVFIYKSGGSYANVGGLVQLEYGSQSTQIEPYGTQWYIKKSIGKVVLDGSEDENWGVSTATHEGFTRFNSSSMPQIKTGNLAICNHFLIGSTSSTTTSNLLDYRTPNQILINTDVASTLANFKTWLSTHNTIVYYVLNTPTYTKITDEELLGQIEALENVLMYQDTTHILQSNSDLPIYLDLTYNSSNQFEMYSLQTRNYGDISLDAWDYITYTLGENAYKTYNNRKLTFEMSIMSDTNTQISNKQQEVTTNIIGGSTETQTRKLRTEVNALDNSITMEVENINIALNNQSAKISGLEINADAISQSVSSLQTLTNDQYNELSNNLDSYKTITDNELNTINNKFSDYATTSDLATIQRSVNQVTTDTYTKTEINSFLVDGSVKKIQTTSLTADESGLTFEKTNAPTKSNINEQGVTVMDNSDNPILRAVYDDEIKNSVVETYRHQVHEYFIMGSHSRFEDYENGTGCFYI